jgi:hypothetical protein
MKKYFFILLIIFISISSFSQGDLLITPYRVVFEGGKTIEEISVANTGKDTAKYTIGFLQYEMLSNGVLKLIKDSVEGVLFADKYLRFFPRTVTLAPNEAQVVRVQLRIPQDLPQAEYRSHLYFRSVVDEKPDMGDGSDSLLGIQLIPVYGISIPLIVRVGNLTVETTISNINYIQGDKPEVEFKINRVGTKSTFGQVDVIHVSKSGVKTVLGRANGLAVYTPLDSRLVKIPLNIPSEVNIKEGEFLVKYFIKVSGKETVFCEESIKIE